MAPEVILQTGDNNLPEVSSCQISLDVVVETAVYDSKYQPSTVFVYMCIRAHPFVTGEHMNSLPLSSNVTGLELKKPETTLYEEFYNSLNTSSPYGIGSTNDAAAAVGIIEIIRF
ncbi:hypothetical protein RJT34_26599 [Clitoria ternatea]|uniref:Uncharacterized protein n=1 Tax=Clitoria ternatea TaxID=43366 RepID=A0AAN9F7F3_CLITE